MHAAITWPVAKPRIRRGLVNHTFGMVRRNPDGSRRPHQGWDFEAKNGTPCFAIADGEIAAVRDIGAYGKQIILRFEFDHDADGDRDTLYAMYAHMSRIDVRQGQRVKRGEHIGLSGSTGNAAGMGPLDQHLHFEIRTMALPPSGLAGRYSPLAVFKTCPMEAV